MLSQVKELLKKHNDEIYEFSKILEKDFDNIMKQFEHTIVPVNLWSPDSDFEIKYCQYNCIYGKNAHKTLWQSDVKEFNDLSLIMQAELVEKLKIKLTKFKKQNNEIY